MDKLAVGCWFFFSINENESVNNPRLKLDALNCLVFNGDRICANKTIRNQTDMAGDDVFIKRSLMMEKPPTACSTNCPIKKWGSFSAAYDKIL